MRQASTKSCTFHHKEKGNLRTAMPMTAEEERDGINGPDYEPRPRSRNHSTGNAAHQHTRGDDCGDIPIRADPNRAQDGDQRREQQ